MGGIGGHVLSTARWGGLVGTLAGLCLSVESLVQNPGIQGLRDRLAVILFFPVLYGLIGLFLGIGVGLVIALLWARRRRWSAAARAAWSLGIIAGLFLFWDAFGRCYACHQWRDWMWPSLTISPGQSIVTMLLVLGRTVLLAAAIGLGAYLIGRWVAAAGQRGRKRRLRRAIPSALVCLAAMVPVLVAVTKEIPRYQPPRYSPEVAAEDAAAVRLIVMDGADWAFMRPLLDAGRLPHIRALMERGVWGGLGIAMPCISPYMWTVLSTGLSDEYHGLCDFFAFRPPASEALITRYPGGLSDSHKRWWFRWLAPRLGRRGIGRTFVASSWQKRVPELWDYLSDAGKRSYVVGWRYTHPPQPLNGLMVTEKFGLPEVRTTTTYPETLEATLPSDFTAPIEECVRRLIGARLAAADPEGLGRMGVRVERVRYHLARDIRLATVARALVDSLPPDLLAVGLTSIDAHEHFYLLEHILSRQGEPPPLSEYYRRFTDEEQLTLFAPVIERTYAVFDSLVGTLTVDAIEEMIVIVSDHGHALDGSGHVFGPPGILVMAGGALRRGLHLEGASVFDITPTILHAMGLPVPTGLQGRVLEDAFEAAWLAAHPVRLLTGEGADTQVFEPGAELPGLSEEELERLRSLGYVE